MTGWPADVYRLCLVASRELTGGRPLVDVVEEAVAGGVTMVQLREKAAPTRAFIAEAAALRQALRNRGVPLIVNDRVDVALAVGADGIHVGQDDMPVDLVRSLVGPAVLIGLSITNEAELRRPDAAAADYLGIGPIFLQATKPDAAPPLGLRGLATLCTAASRPVLAIGGIGPHNAGDVMAAGADGLAVVSAIMGAADARGSARALRMGIDAALRHHV